MMKYCLVEDGMDSLCFFSHSISEGYALLIFIDLGCVWVFLTEG